MLKAKNNSTPTTPHTNSLYNKQMVNHASFSCIFLVSSSHSYTRGTKKKKKKKQKCHIKILQVKKMI